MVCKASLAECVSSVACSRRGTLPARAQNPNQKSDAKIATIHKHLVKNVMNCEVKYEVKSDVKNAVKKRVKNEVKNKVKNTVKNEVKNGVKKK